MNSEKPGARDHDTVGTAADGSASLRIGYLVQDFPPEVGAGPARVLEMSHRWQSLKAEVHVITAMPNRRIPGRGDGAIDPRYRGQLFVRETWEGIDTLRSWLFTSGRQGFANTVLNNASFTISALLHGLARRPPIDVLIASSPPFLPLLSGCALAGALRIPLVVELRDLWPDYLEQLGMIRSRTTLNSLFALERWILRQAAHVVVVTQSFRERVIAKGVPGARVSVIPNGVDLDHYYALPEVAPVDAIRKSSDEFLVGYLGTFGRGQGLRTVVEAAKRVAVQDPTVRFVLVGDGPERKSLVDAATAAGLANLTIGPPIARAQTRAFYNSCDICLVPLAPVPVFQETIPSKIFEVMACERPVLASVGGEAARIIDMSGGGIRVAPGDAHALADAVLQLRRSPSLDRARMGRCGRAYVTAHFDRVALADGYLELLKDVASLQEA